MAGGTASVRRPALVAGLAIALVASLALARTTAPRVDASTTTERAMGRAGFAYLGGLRTFAAAVLWNRIEPLFHEYYGGVPLAEQRYLIPTLYAVTLLDPQFTQAYYMSSFMVGQIVGEDEGIALARRGVDNNPNSGLMHANLAQLLYVQDKARHKAEIVKNIEAGLDPERDWIDNDERFEGYTLMARMLETLGYDEQARAVDEVLVRMEADGLGQGDHDHDGDGKQDH